MIAKHPEVRSILDQLAGRLDDDRMMKLNHMVDELGHRCREVARWFLVREGLIEDDSVEDLKGVEPGLWPHGYTVP